MRTSRFVRSSMVILAVLVISGAIIGIILAPNPAELRAEQHASTAPTSRQVAVPAASSGKSALASEAEKPISSGTPNTPNTSGNWPMSVVAPVLEDPMLLEITAATTLGTLGDFDQVGCEGNVYKVNIPDNRDARLTADPSMGPLQYPIWITGGRNVHVLGIELRPIVQDGCDVGEAHQIKNNIPNIHPRLVGAKAFRLQQSGTTFIEGVDIDLAGMEADCFAVRNPDEMSKAAAFKERHIVIVNTRCVGIEGLDDSPIGDGIHGDFFQNQGRDDIASLVVENVTYLTSSNGITLHNWEGDIGRPQLFSLRNMNYGWDLRYSNDDDYEISGLVFTATADSLDLSNVWLDHGEGLNYGIFNDQRVGSYAQDDYIKQDVNLRSGKPPAGDFAPANKTGIQYASPFLN